MRFYPKRIKIAAFRENHTKHSACTLSVKCQQLSVPTQSALEAATTTLQSCPCSTTSVQGCQGTHRKLFQKPDTHGTVSVCPSGGTSPVRQVFTSLYKSVEVKKKKNKKHPNLSPSEPPPPNPEDAEEMLYRKTTKLGLEIWLRG